MTFTESNTVEKMILDAVARRRDGPPVIHENSLDYGESPGGEVRPARWAYVPATQLSRQMSDVIVESWVREALIRLNPEIAAQPDRTDEVIFTPQTWSALSLPQDGP